MLFNLFFGLKKKHVIIFYLAKSKNKYKNRSLVSTFHIRVPTYIHVSKEGR